MWQLTVFSYLLIFHGHTSQPITDDNENGRQARQLDFGECCPCPSVGEAESSDTTAQDSSLAAGDRPFARARNLDDCSCRSRNPDSEGAPSIFFPVSMRSDGHVVRPVEKNEDPKPLLHPEVDLASSVLQTLREATDEEYQDALEREAARSMAKVAEKTIFRDATPEASTGNMVTIIVSPNDINDLGDVIPQETHVQESHCIHPPLEDVRTNMDKMTVVSKPPNLLRDIFGLPRINEPIDMDSGNSPSDINERVVHADDQLSNRDTQGLRKKYVPLIKLSFNDKKFETPYTTGNVYNECSVDKGPDFKLNSIKNKLNDIVSRKSSKDDQISYLPLIPKIKVNNSFSKQRENNVDLNLSLNNVQESMVGKKSFFGNKSQLENILERTRPVGLKNFLKLKDVELIPLKDTVNNAVKKSKLNIPKLELPAIFNKSIDAFSFNILKKIPIEENKGVKGKIPNRSNVDIFEPENSPSNVIEQISSGECKDGATKKYDTNVNDAKHKIYSTEIIDTALSPSNIQPVEDDRYIEVDNSHRRESINNVDDCVIITLPVTETDVQPTTENYLHPEIQRTDANDLNINNTKNISPDNIEKQQNQQSYLAPNLEDCDNNEFDAMTDSSNIANNIDNGHEKSDDSFVNKNIVNEEPRNGEQRVNDNFKSLDSTPERKFKKPISLDKTLSSIKKNIIKKLEVLKKHKTISRDPNMFNEKIIRGDDTDNKDSASVINETSNPDCQNEDQTSTINQGQESEESIPVTTFKPDCIDEDLEKGKEPSSEISMQDLQEISDSMLQQEEQERKSKTVTCSEPIKKIIDPKMQLEVTSETGSRNTENLQNEVVTDPTNSEGVHDKNENSEQNSCQSKLAKQADTHTEASDVIIDTVFPCNSILESPLLNTEILQPKANSLNVLKSPLPDLQDVIKLEPLPTLEDIKLKLTSLFDKKSEDIEVLSGSEEDTRTEPSNSIMATDASVSSFQSKFPPLRLEDVNLDILQLNPQSSLLSRIPMIDLHSYRTKLPLPNDLSLKPMKLQSALEDNGNIFGATVTVGRNKVHPNNIHKISRVSDKMWENISNLNDRTPMKINLQNILNVPRKSDNLKNRLDISDNSNTWRNVQYMLESRFKEATKKPVNLQSHNLFEFMSRNHEDVTDKLKAIHVDINDRIETMRNNLKDMTKLGTSETRNRNSNTGFSNRHKGKPSSVQTGRFKPTPRRETKKKNTVNTRRWDQQAQSKTEFPQKLHDQKKFKMSASVPVPRTIEVPELKTKLSKSLRPTLQTTSSVNPDIRNVATMTTRESSIHWKPTSKSLRNYNPLKEKQTNPLKDSKVKVFFSTTPRPSTVTTVQSRKTSSHLHQAPQIYTTKVNPGIDSKRENGISSELVTIQRKVPTLGTENNFQSWPKLLESPFILKVKETIKSRLSKGNSPISLKTADVRSGVENSFLNKNENDMSRSASENTDVLLEQTLKENVSYKCKMICTKE